MQKAGLELAIRRRIHETHSDRDTALRRSRHIKSGLQLRKPTRGDAFAMTWDDRLITERKTAGALLLSKIRLAERAAKIMECKLGMLGGSPLICSVH
jgi:hypothetical protein